MKCFFNKAYTCNLQLLNCPMRLILTSTFLFVFYFWTLPIASYGQEHLRISIAPFSAVDSFRVKSLIRKGIPLLYQNTDSAITLFTEAIALSRASGFDDGIGYGLVFLGVAATDKGDYQLGFSYYQQALPYCLHARYIGNALPSLYVNMGVSYYQNGDYRKANEYYYKALRYMEERMPNNDNIAVVYNNLATIQGELNNYPQALAHARKAARLAHQLNIPVVLGGALVNQGAFMAQTDQADSALFYYQQALALGKREHLLDLQQACLTNMGDIKMQAQQYQAAISYFEQSMRISNKTNALHSAIMPGYSLGIAYYRLKNYPKAASILLSSIAIAEQTNFHQKKAVAHATLAAPYEDTHRFDLALEHERKSHAIQDSLTNVEKTAAIKRIESQYASVKKDQAIVQRDFKIALQQKHLAQKNSAIIAIIGGCLLVLLTVWLYLRNRKKIQKRDTEIDQLKAMITGEEKERSRISRELHDGIGGMLTGIKMDLKTLQISQENSSLGVIMHSLQDMGEEIHKMAHNLMPDILIKHNLEEALQLFCEEHSRQLAIDVQLHGSVADLDPSIELPIYRIIQELVQNILKHAEATQAAIQLRKIDHTLFISVEDNGKGFDLKNYKPGLGLENIAARAKALRGFFSIESTPNLGTTAYLEVAIQK